MSPIVEADRSMSPPPNPTPGTRWALVLEQLEQVSRHMTEAGDTQRRHAEALAALRGEVQGLSTISNAAGAAAKACLEAVEQYSKHHATHADDIAQLRDVVTAVAWGSADVHNGLTNMRVLYVEDELVLRKAFQRKLGPLCSVQLAHSPVSARAMLEDNRFDAVILDIDFGSGETGIDLAHWYRELRPGAPVAFVTGRFAEQIHGDSIRTLGDPVPPIFVKPGELPKVVEFLQKAKARIGAR